MLTPCCAEFRLTREAALRRSLDDLRQVDAYVRRVSVHSTAANGAIEGGCAPRRPCAEHTGREPSPEPAPHALGHVRLTNIRGHVFSRTGAIELKAQSGASEGISGVYVVAAPDLGGGEAAIDERRLLFVQRFFIRWESR